MCWQSRTCNYVQLSISPTHIHTHTHTHTGRQTRVIHGHVAVAASGGGCWQQMRQQHDYIPAYTRTCTRAAMTPCHSVHLPTQRCYLCTSTDLIRFRISLYAPRRLLIKVWTMNIIVDGHVPYVDTGDVLYYTSKAGFGPPLSQKSTNLILFGRDLWFKRFSQFSQRIH